MLSSRPIRINCIHNKTIKLPNQNKLEKLTKTNPTSDSSDNLIALCNFEPDASAFSPPDGKFMHILKIRMEKV